MAEIRAYFLVAGFDGSPNEITLMLHLQPDDCASSGELRKSKSGDREIQVKDSYWEICSNLTDSHDLAEYVEDLVSKISPASQYFRKIKEALGKGVLLKIVVAVYIETGKSLSGMYLRPHTMKFLADHNIALEVDMNWGVPLSPGVSMS